MHPFNCLPLKGSELQKQNTNKNKNKITYLQDIVFLTLTLPSGKVMSTPKVLCFWSATPLHSTFKSSFMVELSRYKLLFLVIHSYYPVHQSNQTYKYHLLRIKQELQCNYQSNKINSSTVLIIKMPRHHEKENINNNWKTCQFP